MKFASAVPAGTKLNGLDAIARALVETPKRTHVVIAVINSKTLSTDVDTEWVDPILRVIQIEPLLDDADRALVEDILHRAVRRRTGRPDLFDIDFATGEIKIDSRD